jgi:hypothetical protein
MKECMNCGGPVADDDSHCTTCGLPRGSVIYGERPWSDDDSRKRSAPTCALCGGPLGWGPVADENDENSDICIDCEMDHDSLDD